MTLCLNTFKICLKCLTNQLNGVDICLQFSHIHSNVCNVTINLLAGTVLGHLSTSLSTLSPTFLVVAESSLPSKKNICAPLFSVLTQTQLLVGLAVSEGSIN